MTSKEEKKMADTKIRDSHFKDCPTLRARKRANATEVQDTQYVPSSSFYC